MKPNELAVTFLAATVFMVGCKPNSEPKPADSAKPEGMENTTQQIEKVTKETKEAAQAINDYAYAQRMQFAADMKAKLKDINTQLDQLAVKLETANDDVKTEGKAKLDALRNQVTVLDKKLDDIQNTSESAWDEVKTGFNKSFDQVKDSFTQARQWLSDKIAP